jgi:hypothetical protein
MNDAMWSVESSFFSDAKKNGVFFLKNRNMHGIMKKNCTHQLPNGMINDSKPEITVTAARPVIQTILKCGNSGSVFVILLIACKKRMPHVQQRKVI